MEVQVDNVWATPSTLHMRVSVWGPDHKWRQKFDAHVPIDSIPEESLVAIVAGFLIAPEDDVQPRLPGM